MDQLSLILGEQQERTRPKAPQAVQRINGRRKAFLGSIGEGIRTNEQALYLVSIRANFTKIKLSKQISRLMKLDCICF